jgi:hypothetical protein
MKSKVVIIVFFVCQINFAQNNYKLGSFQINNDGVFDTAINSGNVAGINMGFDGMTGFVKFAAHTGNGFRSDIFYMRGSDGNVGIGTANPFFKLDVNGHGRFNGSVISSGADNEGGQIHLQNTSKISNGIAASWVLYNMTGSYGNSLQFWAYDNLGCGTGLCNNRFTIMDNGNVGIGITYPKNKLDVSGIIHSQEVKVDMDNWSDFVFKKEYVLPTLEEVEKHITEKGHLENIPNEEEVLKNGINLGEMNAKLLQKIEEMTLYIIEQNKQIIDLNKRLEKVESK